MPASEILAWTRSCLKNKFAITIKHGNRKSAYLPLKSSIGRTSSNIAGVLVPEGMCEETIVPISEMLTRTPSAFENEFAIVTNHEDHESLTYH